MPEVIHFSGKLAGVQGQAEKQFVGRVSLPSLPHTTGKSPNIVTSLASTWPGLTLRIGRDTQSHPALAPQPRAAQPRQEGNDELLFSECCLTTRSLATALHSETCQWVSEDSFFAFFFFLPFLHNQVPGKLESSSDDARGGDMRWQSRQHHWASGGSCQQHNCFWASR